MIMREANVTATVYLIDYTKNIMRAKVDSYRVKIRASIYQVSDYIISVKETMYCVYMNISRLCVSASE